MARESIDPTTEVINMLREELAATKKAFTDYQQESELMEREMGTELVMLKREFDNVKTANSNLVTSVDTWKKQCEERDAEIKYLQGELEQVAEEKGDLKKRVNELEQISLQFGDLNGVAIRQQECLERKITEYAGRIAALERELEARSTVDEVNSVNVIEPETIVSNENNEDFMVNRIRGIKNRLKTLEKTFVDCNNNFIQPVFEQLRK